MGPCSNAVKFATTPGPAQEKKGDGELRASVALRAL
jgi:hypothetical protein